MATSELNIYICKLFYFKTLCSLFRTYLKHFPTTFPWCFVSWQTGYHAFVRRADALFCKSTELRYRTCCVRLDSGSCALCSVQISPSFSWTEGKCGSRQRVWPPVSFTHPCVQTYLVSARRQPMLQWTRDLTTCLWMKLEFSSCKTNTMWPCCISDCVILVRFRSTFIDPGKRDFRMGKLQSKHGKECCSWKHWSEKYFDCLTQTNDCLFCIPVSGGPEACKRRENPEGEKRRSFCLMH